MMNLVKRLVAAALVTSTVGSNVALAKGYVFKLDPDFSSVTFSVKHREISYVVGRFKKISGEIVADNVTKPNSLEFKIEVAAKSIFTNNKKRDSHLKGKEIFNARKKPKIEFTSTSIKRITSEKFELTGDLVLNGVTKTLVLSLDVGGPKRIAPLLYRLGVHATFTVLRSEFGLGEGLEDVDDAVTVTVDLQGEYELPPVG